MFCNLPHLSPCVVSSERYMNFCVAGHRGQQDAESLELWSWLLPFVKGYPANILADTIFCREIDKFSNSASSLGPQPPRHSSIHQRSSIYSSFFKLRASHPQCIHKQICASSLWSIARIPLSQHQKLSLLRVKDTLPHGRILFVIPTDRDPYSSIHPVHHHEFLWLLTPHRKDKVCIHSSPPSVHL